MKAQIEENLYIESDAYGFMLKRYGTRIVKKDGEEDKQVDTTETLGSFHTIRGAVKFLVGLKVKESTATTLSELLQDVERIEAYIESKIAV